MTSLIGGLVDGLTVASLSGRLMEDFTAASLVGTLIDRPYGVLLFQKG